MNGKGALKKPQAFFVNTTGSPYFEEVFHERNRTKLENLADLNPLVVTPENFATHHDRITEAEILIGTWGFPVELAEKLAELPNLKMVLYAGGSARCFAKPFLERGIAVVIARETNAKVVAEFCLAQIILANKGYFRNIRATRDPLTAHPLVAPIGLGNHGATVALLGYGAIGRNLRMLLRPFRIDILVVDPTLPKETAEHDGFRLVDLAEAFRTAHVVSNHLPNFPHLQHCLKSEHFASMPEGGTFINTGRGAQVEEEGLVQVLKKRPDLTALLDVTSPEPPDPECELYTLPNALLSSHIAGVIGQERNLLVQTIAEDLERYLQGLPLLHAIDIAIWESMA